MLKVNTHVIDDPVSQEPPLVQDFENIYLEIIRLLREATEVEHSLLLQYLYAAYSVKPDKKFQDIIVGAPQANHAPPRMGEKLLGVAIEEMLHLSEVNLMLVDLGCNPSFIRQDFPYKVDIYPFEFNLEPLSKNSVAKYVYTEAPKSAFDPEHRDYDKQFAESVLAELGSKKPNRIGSLYKTIIELMERLNQDPRFQGKFKIDKHLKSLRNIKDEGEVAHFEYFKELFIGKFPENGVADIWQEDPALKIPFNPTAFKVAANTNKALNLDENIRKVAWCANIIYWLALLILTYKFKYNNQFKEAAVKLMFLLQGFAKSLAKRGFGVPFDPFNLDYNPGLSRQSYLFLFSQLIDEFEINIRKINEADADLIAGISLKTIADLKTVITEEMNESSAGNDAPGGDNNQN